MVSAAELQRVLHALLTGLEGQHAVCTVIEGNNFVVNVESGQAAVQFWKPDIECPGHMRRAVFIF